MRVPDHLLAVEHLARAVRGEVLARTAVDGLARLAPLVVLPVARPTRMGTLRDQGPLQFRRRPQDVKQEPRGGVLLVRVQALGDCDETDPAVLQRVDAVDEVDQGTPEAVQFPAQDAVELPVAGVRHQPVKSGASGLGSAHYVLVGACDVPALAEGVVPEFPQLEFTVLVLGGDAGVENDSHRLPPGAVHRRAAMCAARIAITVGALGVPRAASVGLRNDCRHAARKGHPSAVGALPVPVPRRKLKDLSRLFHSPRPATFSTTCT